jgi:hypothetical protein
MPEILTAEDKAAIRKALKDAEVMRAELAKAKRAGLDVAALEKQLQEAELALSNIKRVYMTRET